MKCSVCGATKDLTVITCDPGNLYSVKYVACKDIDACEKREDNNVPQPDILNGWDPTRYCG